MRVCFVSRRFFPAISGMSVYALNLLRELTAAGHELTMISQYRGDAEGRAVYGGGPPPPVPGVRVIGLEALGEQDGGDFERDVRTMSDTVVAEHARAPYDLVHAQYAYPTGLAALDASRRLGIPNVVSIQGGDGHWVGSCCSTHEHAMRIVLDHAGALLIGSRSFASEVQERLGTPAERFTIVPGAVDTTRFRPVDAAPARAEPVVLYHGRVDRRKGALDLLDAVAGLAAAGRRPPVVMSGIGPDLDAARARVGELGLDAQVELTGHAEYAAVPAVYARGDVFASPTYAEGFSNTILEAMASGLPVLSCRATGVVDCVRDGDNGILVEPGDVPALGAALGRLLDDASLRDRLAATALAEVREHYAWPAVAGRIGDVYASLSGSAPDAAWAAPAGPPAPCRFRSAPHLL